ncbi:hypothetical protein P692DRAFT_20866267 [Suillus brevipes Sb2]|nr:hypothetical protein P692DRAFT_20866267 [Suillus brevipes Sb2]
MPPITTKETQPRRMPPASYSPFRPTYNPQLTCHSSVRLQTPDSTILNHDFSVPLHSVLGPAINNKPSITHPVPAINKPSVPAIHKPPIPQPKSQAYYAIKSTPPDPAPPVLPSAIREELRATWKFDPRVPTRLGSLAGCKLRPRRPVVLCEEIEGEESGGDDIERFEIRIYAMKLRIRRWYHAPELWRRMVNGTQATAKIFTAKTVLGKLIQQSIAGFPLGTPPPTPRPVYACLQVGPGPETAMEHSIFPHMFGAFGLVGAPTPSGFSVSWIKGGTHGRAY